MMFCMNISSQRISSVFVGYSDPSLCIVLRRSLSLSRKRLVRVLGIESSCDDTGVAVVDHSGCVISEHVIKQVDHQRFGGVMPNLAKKWHHKNLAPALDLVLNNPVLDCGWPERLDGIDAIAVTNRPGLAGSLEQGAAKALCLSRTFGIPLIPIHHMEAHALTVRMTDPNVGYPFLCLLISGGNCLLVWVEGVDKFSLMGTTVDNAPGEMLDKVARRLKLQHLGPEWEQLNGGAAIEKAGLLGNRTIFQFPVSARQSHTCNFSFCDLYRYCFRTITQLEEEDGIEGGGIINNLSDFCAGLENCVYQHLARAFLNAVCVLRHRQLIDYPPNPDGDLDIINETENRPDPSVDLVRNYLVVSGGVASNAHIRRGLDYVCSKVGFKLVAPPPRLCTDNGVMIAWNGVERLLNDRGVISPRNLPSNLPVFAKCGFDCDWRSDIDRLGLRFERDFSLNKIPV